MKKLYFLSCLIFILTFTSCSMEEKFPQLRFYNASKYTICMEMGYLDSNNSYSMEIAKVVLNSGSSHSYYIDKDKHFNDVVYVRFWVDYNGDGWAQYACSWEMGNVKYYPDNGYVYSRITVPYKGDVEVTYEEISNTRSIQSNDLNVTLKGEIDTTLDFCEEKILETN